MCSGNYLIKSYFLYSLLSASYAMYILYGFIQRIMKISIQISLLYRDWWCWEYQDFRKWQLDIVLRWPIKIKYKNIKSEMQINCIWNEILINNTMVKQINPHIFVLTWVKTNTSTSSSKKITFIMGIIIRMQSKF